MISKSFRQPKALIRGLFVVVLCLGLAGGSVLSSELPDSEEFMQDVIDEYNKLTSFSLVVKQVISIGGEVEETHVSYWYDWPLVRVEVVDIDEHGEPIEGSFDFSILDSAKGTASHVGQDGVWLTQVIDPVMEPGATPDYAAQMLGLVAGAFYEPMREVEQDGVNFYVVRMEPEGQQDPYYVEYWVDSADKRIVRQVVGVRDAFVMDPTAPPDSLTLDITHFVVEPDFDDEVFAVPAGTEIIASQFGAVIPRAAPEFSAETADGALFSTEDFGGQLAVVVFWGESDDDSIETQYGMGLQEALLMELQSIYSYLKEYEVRVYGIGTYYEGDEEELKILENAGVEFPVVYDADAELTRLFGVSKLPAVALIDEQGRIRYLSDVDTYPVFFEDMGLIITYMMSF